MALKRWVIPTGLIIFIIGVILFITSIVFIVKAGYRNVDYVKSKATETSTQSHLLITGYEGYQWSPIFGGYVWYIFNKVPNNGISYHGAFFKRSNGEIHLQDLSAIDAIKP
jgi:hypothetical protein